MTSTTPDLSKIPTDDSCPSCQHPLSLHDPLGKRWCAATKLGVGTRSCICSEAVTKVWARGRY